MEIGQQDSDASMYVSTGKLNTLSMLSNCDGERFLDVKQRGHFLSLLLNSRDIGSLAKGIYACDFLKEKLWGLFLAEMKEDVNVLREKRSSYLHHGNVENLMSFNWDDVVEELCSKQPLLAQVLLNVISAKPMTSSNSYEKLIKPLSTIYGILMKTRTKEC